MRGQPVVGLLLAVSLIACDSNDTSPTTGIVEPVTTSTTTTLAATTTSIDDTPTDICARGVVWEPGTTYIAECFLVPVAFRPATAGWRSFGGNLQAAQAELWGGEGALVGVQLLGYESEIPHAEVLDLILAIDGVEEITPPREATIASWSGVTTDIRTEPDTSPARPTQEPEECSRTGFALKWFFDAWPGYPLVVEFPREYGLGACYRFRVWVLDVEGESITVMAVVFDPDRFEERIGDAEELLATMTLAP